MGVEIGEGGGDGWSWWEEVGEKARKLYLKNNKMFLKMEKKNLITLLGEGNTKTLKWFWQYLLIFLM